MMKTLGTLEEGSGDVKIKRGWLERVGVNRRRRERRCLSFKDVPRIPRRANSHTEQSAKRECHGDGGEKVKPG